MLRVGCVRMNARQQRNSFRSKFESGYIDIKVNAVVSREKEVVVFRARSAQSVAKGGKSQVQ